MQSNTIALAGCQKSTQIVIMTALKSAGFKVIYLPYDVRYHAENLPDCLLIDLQGDDVIKARQMIDQPSLKATKKLLMLDTRDQKARQFISAANVDDILFKPIQIEELVARLQALLKKTTAQHDPTDIKDEFSFAQTIQDLEARQFTGCLRLHGKHVAGEMHLMLGRINGVRIGQKLQGIALTALWRIFPSRPELLPNAPVPDWATPPLNITAEEVIGNVAHASSEFRSIFPGQQGLLTVFKLNSSVYEAAFHTLPRQVRRLVQTFDGDRTLNDIFSYINLDEFVLMQILRRLLDENLIIENQSSDDIDRLSLVDWIRGVSETDDPLESSNTEITVRMPPPMPKPPKRQSQPREEKTIRMPPPIPEPARTSKPQPPARPTDPIGQSAADSDELPDHATHSILMYAFPTQIQQAETSAQSSDADDDRPFHAEPVVRKKFSREVVEQKFQKTPPTFIEGDIQIRKGTYYSDAQLEEEAARTANHAQLSQKPSSLTLVLDETKRAITLESSIADASIQEVENEITRIAAASQFNTPDEDEQKPETAPKTPAQPAPEPPLAHEDSLRAKREHLEQMQKLYEQNHSEELSKENWREQTITRLNRENAETSAKLKRNLALLILLLLLAGALIFVLITGTFSPKQATINTGTPKTAPVVHTQAAPDHPIPEEITQETAQTADEQQPLPVQAIEPDAGENADTPENTQQDDSAVQAAIADAQPQAPKEAPAIAHAHAPARTALAAKQPTTREETPKPSSPQTDEPISIKTALQNTRSEMNIKNWEAAQTQVEIALAMDPKHPIANVLAGQIQAKLGNFNKAISYYKIAEKANAQKSVYWVQLSEYYRAAGNFTESDKAIDKAIAIVGSASPEGRKLVMQKSRP